MANARARHLRKHLTVAEVRLWKELRKFRHHGYHFRRQVPIEGYIVDFACLSQRVIIELDGVQHQETMAQRRDAARDADLSWRGFKILRFRNDQVAQELDGVILDILGALGAEARQE